MQARKDPLVKANTSATSEKARSVLVYWMMWVTHRNNTGSPNRRKKCSDVVGQEGARSSDKD